MSDTLNTPRIIDEQESSFDFGKIIKDLLKHKRLYFIVLLLSLILAAIWALGEQAQRPSSQPSTPTS